MHCSFFIVNVGNGTANGKKKCSGEVESIMMENLALDMIDISFWMIYVGEKRVIFAPHC